MINWENIDYNFLGKFITSVRAVTDKKTTALYHHCIVSTMTDDFIELEGYLPGNFQMLIIDRL